METGYPVASLYKLSVRLSFVTIGRRRGTLSTVDLETSVNLGNQQIEDGYLLGSQNARLA